MKRRKARRTFVSTLLAWLALNVGLILVLEQRPDYRDSLSYVKQDVFAERLTKEPADAITILGIGTSRTGAGLDTPLLEQELAPRLTRPLVAYNASVVGSGPYYEWLHLQRFLQRAPKPTMVVLEVLPSFFGPHGPEYEAKTLRPDRLTRAEAQQVIALGIPEEPLAHDWWRVNLNPWMGLRFQLLGMVKPTWTPPNSPRYYRDMRNPHGYYAWKTTVTPASYNAGLATAREQYFETLKKVRFDTQSREVFRMMIEQLQALGIHCIVLAYPEASQFRAWYPPASIASLNQFMAEITKDYGIPAINAQEWLADDAFVDGHHLHDQGAKRFTTRFVNEVLQPYFKRQGLVRPD